MSKWLFGGLDRERGHKTVGTERNENNVKREDQGDIIKKVIKE